MANEMYCDNFIMSEDGEKFEMTQTSKGDPGFSPIANVTQEGDVTTITITDEKGTTTADIDISGKVDKVEGKGLSTNDYTNAEKQKVADAALQTDLTDLARQVSGKQNAPATAGAAGQVLSLNDQLQPIWTDGGSSEDAAPVIINTASGAIASFSDGANGMPIRKLVAQIEPVQDLHGYDHPWPAGGGLNKMPAAPVSSNTVNGITYTSDGNGRYTIKGTASEKVNVDFNFNEVSRLIADGKLSLFNSATGINLWFMLDGSYQTYWHLAPANRTATIVAADAKEFDGIRVIVDSGASIDLSFSPMIYEGDTQTTFSPYSNECPISGWTGAEIEQAGKNLWGGLDMANDFVNAINNPSNCYLGVDTDGDYVTFAAGSQTHNKTMFVGPFKENTIYTYILNIKRDSAGDSTNIVFRYTDGTASVITFNMEANVLYNVAVPTITGKTLASVGTGFYSGRIYLYYEDSGLFEGVLTADDFVPYIGNQISVTFPASAGDSGTVYGGTLTLTPDRTGTLAVTLKEADMGSLDDWSYQSTNTCFYCDLQDKKAGLCTAITPITKPADATYGVPDYCLSTSNAVPKRIFTSFPEYTTVAAFKAAMTGVPLIYELEEPVVYHLTESEVSGILSTLYGTNNIWADTGDTEVTYPCDTRLYIDNKITQAIAAALNA